MSIEIILTKLVNLVRKAGIRKSTVVRQMYRRRMAFRLGLPATTGVTLLRPRLRSPDYLVRFAQAVLAQGHTWEGHFAVAEEDRLRIVPLPTP